MRLNFLSFPPYVLERRKLNKRKGVYDHEMGKDQHRELASILRNAEGMVVLSGNNSALYGEELYPDWVKFSRKGFGDSDEKSQECVFLNPACVTALEAQSAQANLFG